MSTATMNHSISSISPARRGLLHLMNRIEYGRIEELWVRDGEPVLDPLPRIIREVKLGRRSRCREVAKHDDFALKDQVVDLFGYLDRIRDGVIEKVEIQAGLPFRIHVSESVND